MPPSPTRLPALLRAAVLLAATLVFAGLPTSLWFQRQDPPVAMPWSVIALGAVIGLIVLFLVRPFARRVVTASQRGMQRVTPSIVWPLIAGLVLRVLSGVVIQPTATSDGATYLGLASTLVKTHEYVWAGTRAYWPPGLPFVLSPLIRVLDAGLPMLIVYGLATFVVAALGTYRLGQAIGLGRTAVVPVWMVALWPPLVFCCGLPEKELLLIALLPWIVWCGIELFRGSRRAAAGGGLLLGCATISQPSLQLLCLLPFLFIPFVRGSQWSLAGRCLIFLLTTLLVLAPWVYRNARILDGAAMIATNGGSNLYRANNELATGAYVRRGVVDVDALDEVASDARGKALARAWIRQDPLRFIQLAAGKALLFAGDDSYGAFAALRRGRPEGGNAIAYGVGKVVAMLPWVLMWMVAAAAVWRRGFAERAIDPLALGAFVPYAYLSGIHAVFESGGRYHYPASSCLFVGVVWLLVRATPQPKPS